MRNRAYVLHNQLWPHYTNVKMCNPEMGWGGIEEKTNQIHIAYAGNDIYRNGFVRHCWMELIWWCVWVRCSHIYWYIFAYKHPRTRVRAFINTSWISIVNWHDWHVEARVQNKRTSPFDLIPIANVDIVHTCFGCPMWLCTRFVFLLLFLECQSPCK